MAIGSEKVKQFEQAAHAEHQRSLGEIMAQARQRFDDFLTTACVGLDDLELNLSEVSASRANIKQLVAHFSGHDWLPEAPTNVLEEPKR